MMDISLQLYSIKEETAANFPEALMMARQAGYQGVEFAGYGGLKAEALARLLADCGLKAVSAHVGLPRLREAFDAELDYAQRLGYALVICPYSACETLDEAVSDAVFLEACAQAAAKRGVTLGYHNHAHEFRNVFDGKRAMDVILERAPTLKFQPDVYWLAVGGADPVAYLTPLVQAGRVCAIHAKERATNGDANVYIGAGGIDFTALARLCPPDVYPWIVEQEAFSSSHADGIAQSYAGLRRVFDAL
ncbi:MAG: sugar phosphate isomerase/epimerase [Treponema sp.]|jgi:sugar phosphate isomerase/epimerase|nr:sugar phosphate isomerase/epimerase [Treponema sp.]